MGAYIARSSFDRQDVTSDERVAFRVHDAIVEDALYRVHFVAVVDLIRPVKLAHRKFLAEVAGGHYSCVSAFDRVRVVLHVLGGLLLEVKAHVAVVSNVVGRASLQMIVTESVVDLDGSLDFCRPALVCSST